MDRRHEAEDDEPVELEKGYRNIVVVDNVPVVDVNTFPVKFEKLQSILLRVFAGAGVLAVEDTSSIYFPQSPEGSTKGFCFVEYKNAAEAKKAVAQLSGFKLDKSHVFVADLFDELDRVESVAPTYVPPVIPDYTEREFLHHWLCDPLARDQFVVRNGEETSICWMQTPRKPDLIISKGDWADPNMPVMWSPRGTYLASFYAQGIRLSGGPSWATLGQFAHFGVRLVDFSPCETFMLTFSPAVADEAIVVWDVRSCKRIRTFPLPAPERGQQTQSPPWPYFHWSHDEKFFARLRPNEGIDVFDSSTMLRLDEKMVKIEGIQDFAWSPSEDNIAYWVPERGSQPAKVVLIAIPSMTVIRTKNLVNVADCALHWHGAGDFLCVKIGQQKSKKVVQTKFEIFSIREKDIPTQSVEMGASPVLAFAWEPKGKRFGIIHGEPPRVDVSFYEMQPQKIKPLKTFAQRAANHLFWSPRGQFCILAGLKNLNGVLEFVNLDTQETFATGEHLMCTDVEWDPTGRYVSTSINNLRAMGNNEFNIWSFQGKPLHHITKEKFYMVQWRPRPPSLLSEKQEAEIQHDLRRVYEPRYRAADQKERSSMRVEAQQAKKNMRAEFTAYLLEKKRELAAERSARIALCGFDVASDMADEDFVMTEETVEEVLDEREEVLLD